VWRRGAPQKRQPGSADSAGRESIRSRSSTFTGRSQSTNVGRPPVLSRRAAKAARPDGRSIRVERPEILVSVEAYGALRRQIVAALEADGISLAPDGASAAADIRVLSVDLSQPVPPRRLREILGGGSGRVVVVSPKCGALGLRRAMRAGADSLVLEQELADALAPAARAVAAGLSVMPTVLRNGAERASFSHREREVLRLAVTGHTNCQIASKLFLAESTVKSHLSSAYRKLGAGGRSDAARMVFDPDEGLAEIVLGHVTADRVASEGHAA
jgi:DNA-binding NarL/FixJ family response regulator